MPETKALLMLTWSRYLMKYPSEANERSTASSLNRNRLSSGDLSKVSHRYEVHRLFTFVWTISEERESVLSTLIEPNDLLSGLWLGELSVGSAEGIL